MEEKRQEEEQLRLLKEQEDAMEKKRLADLKEKELEEAMEKKKKDDLEKKEKKDAARKLRKEQKKPEKSKKVTESSGLLDVAELLLQEEKGTNGDSEGELSEASKVHALQQLKEKHEGKQRVMESAGSTVEVRKRKQPTKSASVVDSREEGVAGTSKKVKLEVTGPVESKDEFLGTSRCFPPAAYWLLTSVSEHCMQCHLDSAKCFVKPASKKSNQGWTCSHCKIKKSACSFNKGTTSSLAIGSNEVSEVLHNLVATVTVLAGKVNSLTGEVAFLWSHVGNLCDNYCMEDIESPRDLLSESNTEEWKMSCAELHNLKSVNTEALWQVMGFHLDCDMVQLRKGRLLELKEVDPKDPYKIANHQFWYDTRGPEMIEVMKVCHELFQGMRNEFYKLGGCRAEWQFWKDHLQKHCEDFMVEDSDVDEKVLDGKVQKAMKPYRDDLGIPAFNNLFVLDLDPTAVNTSEEDEDEDSVEESDSTEDEGEVPAEEQDVEMAEAANAVSGSNTSIPPDVILLGLFCMHI